MSNRVTYKSKHLFFVLIKISLVVAAFYFIYYKLTKSYNLDFTVFIQFLIKNRVFSLKTITFLVVLTIFNWFFEILKWQELVSSVKKINLKNSFEQCLGSLTASLFTPNRVGEYGAKAIYFAGPLRKRILLINFLSNLLQMGVTTILGSIGLLFFTQKHVINIDTSKLAIILLISSFTIILIGFLIRKSNFHIKGFSLEKIWKFIFRFPRKKLAIGATYSLARYIVFSFQFYYLLAIFGIQLNYLNAMIVITSMYFLASIIPSIFIFDVVIKGGVAVYLFSFVGVDELIVLSVVTLMWILNFVFPSIIGSYFVLQFDFPKKSH